MKRSELKELIQEAMKGYSRYAPGGTTNGGTTADFGTILKNIALGKDQVSRGNAILDKANPDNVARITRGEKPVYEQDATQKYVVHFRIGEDDEDDVEVTASTPEQAIQKVKSGEVKLAHGQSLPRTARSFSAKPL